MPSTIRHPLSALSNILLALTLILYFCLALPQLELPGLHNDEAQEAGLQAMQIISGQNVSAFRDAGLNLNGKILPFMVQDYIGAFNVYFLLPFFATLGSTVYALRLYTILIGAVTLVLTFGFLRDAFNTRVAFIATLLLATMPSYIFWQRQGVYVSSLTCTFTLALLWSGYKWFKQPQARWAILAGLFCGFGLYAKLLFIWIIGGVVGALVISNWRLIIESLRQPKILISTLRSPLIIQFSFFILSFVISLLPLFLYNLQTGGTFLSVGTNLTTSYYGVNNLDFFKNLLGRIDQYQAVIAGREHLWYLGGSFGNSGWDTALRVAALALVARFLLRRPNSKLPLILLLTLVLGVIQSSFTVSGIFPTHHAIFMPLLPMIVAVACEIIFDPFYEPLTIHINPVIGSAISNALGFLSIGTIVLATSLGWLWATDLTNTIQYHLALQKSGGLSVHSDAIYRLTNYLTTSHPKNVYALDWGVAPQIRMLTQDKIVPQEIFGYAWEADEDFENRLSAAVGTPEAVFVFHWGTETIFPRRAAFESFLKSRGLASEQIAQIGRRDGAPMFEVLRIKK